MMNIDISQQSIDAMFLQFKNEFSQLEYLWKGHNDKADTGYFEGQLAYILIRKYKPEIIFEIGPNYGFSTYPLALAVKNNGFGKVYSFEKEHTALEGLNRNIQNAKLSDIVTIVPGDFRDTGLDILNITKKIDLLWIDDGHDDYIAEWYIANLFPHTKQLVFVHDMTFGTPNPHDEKHVVFEFLEKNNIYPNFLVKNFIPSTIEKIDGPGGSANSGIWIDISK